MKKFLFKPVREVMEKRQAEIEESYKKAEKVNEDAEHLKAKYEESLGNIEEERKNTINKAKFDASREYDEIVNNANKKADKIIAEAKIQAEKEAETKQREMQQQMAVLVAEAAYKIAASQDSEANDRKLFDQFINGDSSTVKPSNQEA
jgi:F-type H+-transporting ATPase subunit b